MDHNYAASASSSARIELVDGSPEEEDKDQPQNGNNFGANVEKEHMFDKVVTPSDVGKLNRLVIPKQHAEKYFPLDSSRDEKGLLLNFEDRTGKAWRFRYSYWNSSQSYVMTKGWSRFVKEKKLDAGDIVSFHRGNNKFFIDWRRRPRPDDALLPPPPFLHFSFHHRPPPLVGGGWGGGGGGSGSIAAPAFVLRSSYPYDRDPPHHPYHHNNNHHHHPVGAIWDHIRRPSLFPVNAMSMLPSVPHPHWIRSSSTSTTGNYSSSPHSAPMHLSRISSSSPSGDDHHQRVVQQQQVHKEEGGGEPMVFDSVPVVQGKAAGKRLRLFGVNMDCPNSNSNDNYEQYEDGLPSITTSSSTSDHHHHHHHDHHQAMLPNHEDRLPLQLSLTVDKGKLSSSSSSMSLDLDM